MLPNMQGLVEYEIYVSQVKLPMSGRNAAYGTRDYLTVWSTSRSLSLPAVKLICKNIYPNGWR